MNAVAQTNVVEVKKPDFYAIEKVGGEIAFPEVFSQGEVGKVTRRVNRHPDCIQSNPDYIPDETTLRRALAWWHTPMRMALGLHGETGTGKTELLLYIADRLNEPVYMVKVHPALMPEDLEGNKELVNGANGVVPNTNFVDRVCWIFKVNQCASYKSKRALLCCYDFKLPMYQWINVIQDRVV